MPMIPKLSVIVSTSSPSRCMTDLEENHLVHTINNGINRQTFKDFELIISDTRWAERSKEMDWKQVFSVSCSAPIYHVPITHSVPSIQAARNNGAMFASGSFLLFLNDCCTFEARFLEKIIEEWEECGLFPCPLFIMQRGAHEEINESGDIIRDPRFKIFDSHPRDANKFETGETVIDDFMIGNYFSCTLSSFIDVRGIDEILGLERFGEKLKSNRNHLSIHRKIVVKEQKKKSCESTAGRALGPFDIVQMRNERLLKKHEYKVR